MRLLNLKVDGTFILREFTGSSTPSYGILSHTWGADGDEVTLKDLLDGTAKGKIGYRKLQFCAKQAASDNLEWIWVDTCNIDKTSSAELSEAINSMYRWYQTSSKCYVYLSDVTAAQPIGAGPVETNKQAWDTSLRSSRWFTRGWTLQELLAPKNVEFFSSDGVRLGDKSSLALQIQEITAISLRALQETNLYEFSVAERMSWAKNRQTTREEDLAYSLLGIFDVNMPLLYGEGQKKALSRLYREIRDSLPSDRPEAPIIQLNALDLENAPSQDQNEGQFAAPLLRYTPCSPLDNAPIAAVALSQKDIDVAVLGEDSILRYIRLENGIPTMPKWQSDSKWFADVPLMMSSRKSQLDIFATTPYGQVFYQQTKTGLLLKEHWECLGGTIIGPLAGVSSAPNRLDIFGLGEDGKVMHKTLVHGTWLPSKDTWEDLGGTFSLPPHVISSTPGSFDILSVKGYNSYLAHKSWNGSAWAPASPQWAGINVNGMWMCPPTAVATKPNEFYVFLRGTAPTSLLYKTGPNWGWHTDWKSIDPPRDDGAWISRPAVIVSKAGRLHLFCLWSDNELYYKLLLLHEKRWEDWSSLGGDFTSAPTAVSTRSGEVYVFCKGYDEEIHYMNLDHREWKSLGYVE